MTPSPTDNAEAYAGASQSAAEVAERAIGTPESAAAMLNRPKAQGDGFYIDDAGVRRKIRAGDPVPPGVTLQGTSTEPSDAKAAKAPAEDKAAKAPAEKK